MSEGNPIQPPKYTHEQIAELEKSRTISDAELLQDRAEYVVDEKGNKVLRRLDNFVQRSRMLS